MKRIIWKSLIALLLIFTFCFGVFAQSEAEMEEDAEKIHDIYKKIKAIEDFRIPEGVGQDFASVQKALDGMNKTRLLSDEYAQFTNGFAEKYAPNSKDYEIPRNLSKKFEPLELGYDVGFEYEQIIFKFSLLKTAGEKNASIILKQVQDMVDNPERLKFRHEITRVKDIENALQMLNVVSLFDSGNVRVERRGARLQVKVEELLKEYKADEAKTLASRRWKENVASTSAGSPSTLASGGKRFLIGQSDWGGNTKRGTKILKVSIIGDWFVAERSFGRPTRYGLPAAVAVKDNTMPEGVITIYEVSLITREPKKNTNFLGVWVGKVWRMLEKNLPN